MPVPVFLTDPVTLEGDVAALGDAEAHHLRVRRLRVGSAVVLADGRGRQRPGVVVAVDALHAVVRFTGGLVGGAESPCRITLAQAALKADKLDLVVEKTTELGVSAILIYTCSRSLGSVAAARRERWERIARSAAKQCGRSVVPDIVGPVPCDTVFAPPSAPTRLLFLEAQDAASKAASVDIRGLNAVDAVMAIVGPEGGFTAAEAARSAQAGCHPVSLGRRVLRAETAAIAAVTLCQFLWGDLSGSPV